MFVWCRLPSDRFSGWWLRFAVCFFGSLLTVSKATAGLFEEVARLRQELEGRSVAHDSAEGAVEFVMQLQEVQRRLPAWSEQLAVAARSHETLRRHRWTPPAADWVPLEMAEAEFSAFSELVKRRQAALALRLPELTQDVLRETQSAEQSVAALKKDWESDSGRPRGSAAGDTALQALAAFHLRARQLQDRWVRLQSARHALEAAASGAALAERQGEENAAVAAVLDECAELKARLRRLLCWELLILPFFPAQEVWTQLGQVWRRLRETGAQAWGGVIPRRVRTALDERLQELRGLPAKVKQYEAFDRLQSTVKVLC